MITVTPPLEFTNSSELEDFIVNQRLRPLFLPRVCLLDLIYASGRCYPSELSRFCSFDSYRVLSKLIRVSDLCTPCNRFLCKTWFLRVTVHALQQFALHSLQRGSFMLSLLSFGIETDSYQLTSCIQCAHLALTQQKRNN
jgi:hypothetical protein